MSNEGTHQPTQRNKGFSALIPFYILYDLDLNAHHIRLYGQIQQMESNPNPDVTPTFSYAWLAEQLGVNDVRYVKRLAKLMKDKKYIERIKSEKKWVWQTVKKGVLIEDDTDSPTQGVVTQTTQGVVTQTTLRYKRKGIKEKGVAETPTNTNFCCLFSDRHIPHPAKGTLFTDKVIKQAIEQLKKHGFTLESYLDYLVNECGNWLFEPYDDGRVNDLFVILRQANIEKGCLGKFEDKQ